MRLRTLLIAAALPLSACAGPYYGGYGGYGGGVAYDGYYDNYYGPIYDGYWGEGDVFYYRGHRRGHYIRDDGGHFNRGGPGFSPRPGFREFHGMGPGGPPNPRAGWRHR